MASNLQDHTMRRCVRKPALLLFLPILFAACNRTHPVTAHAADPQKPAAPTAAPEKREVRVTGTVQAVHTFKILVPQIYGNYSNMTLTHIVANGTKVKEGDLIAT